MYINHRQFIFEKPAPLGSILTLHLSDDQRLTTLDSLPSYSYSVALSFVITSLIDFIEKNYPQF